MKEFKAIDEKKRIYNFQWKENQYISFSQFYDKKAIGDVNFLVISFLYFYFH